MKFWSKNMTTVESSKSNKKIDIVLMVISGLKFLSGEYYKNRTFHKSQKFISIWPTCECRFLWASYNYPKTYTASRIQRHNNYILATVTCRWNSNNKKP